MLAHYSNPSYSLAKFLKAHYLPNTDFMEAKQRAYPSFTKRSILSAQHLIEMGAGWRVGNVHNINIWNDVWFLAQEMEGLDVKILMLDSQQHLSWLMLKTIHGWRIGLNLSWMQIKLKRYWQSHLQERGVQMFWFGVMKVYANTLQRVITMS